MSDGSRGEGPGTGPGQAVGVASRRPRAGAGGLGWALCWAKASGPVGFCKYLNTGRTIFGGYGLSPGLAGCRAGCRVTAASPHTPLRPRLPGAGLRRRPLPRRVQGSPFGDSMGTQRPRAVTSGARPA